MQLLASVRIDKRQLGDGRNLAQQSQAVEAAFLRRVRRPWQLGHPAQLIFDLLDKLPDFVGRSSRLLALDANQGGLVILVGQPNVGHAVGEQRDRYDSHDEHDVLAKQSAGHLGFRGSRRSDIAGVRAGHAINSSARMRSARGTVSPSVLAVFMLMTNSIFLTNCTGRSAGLSPLRMRPM